MMSSPSTAIAPQPFESSSCDGGLQKCCGPVEPQAPKQPEKVLIPLSLSDDCRQRDMRCCRSLNVESLELFLLGISTENEAHMIAPVSGGVCAVCRQDDHRHSSEDEDGEDGITSKDASPSLESPPRVADVKRESGNDKSPSISAASALHHPAAPFFFGGGYPPCLTHGTPPSQMMSLQAQMAAHWMAQMSAMGMPGMPMPGSPLFPPFSQPAHGMLAHPAAAGMQASPFQGPPAPMGGMPFQSPMCTLSWAMNPHALASTNPEMWRQPCSYGPPSSSSVPASFASFLTPTLATPLFPVPPTKPSPAHSRTQDDKSTSKPLAVLPPLSTSRPATSTAPSKALKHGSPHAEVEASAGPAKRKRRTCEHMSSKFNSTVNLKRRVHILLFWKASLGARFPVLDEMLRDNVWRNLESCEYGIKRSNGHPKFRRTGACINPFHYKPLSYTPLIAALDAALVSLEVLPQHAELAVLFSRAREAGRTEEQDETLFRAICTRIQQLSFVTR